MYEGVAFRVLKSNDYWASVADHKFPNRDKHHSKI